jgi:hypothetical protein
MTIEDFEAGIEKMTKKENSSRFERFLVRKYKCFIIFIMALLSISEMIYLVLQKNSDSFINDVIEKYFNATRNLNNKIK